MNPRQTDRGFAARDFSKSVSLPRSTVSHQNFRLSILAKPTIHANYSRSSSSLYILAFLFRVATLPLCTRRRMAAESIGLAASFAGLVSLGLQITGGIVQYIDAFESRQKELDFLRHQNEALYATLRVVNAWLGSHGQSGEVTAAADLSMQLLQEELESVKVLYTELADRNGQNWAVRLDNKKKRFTYAFSRSKIQELGQRLQKASNALQLTLNALGL